MSEEKTIASSCTIMASNIEPKLQIEWDALDLAEKAGLRGEADIQKVYLMIAELASIILKAKLR